MLYQLSYRLLGVIENWKTATRLYRQVSIAAQPARHPPISIHPRPALAARLPPAGMQMRHRIELLLLIGIEHRVKLLKSFCSDRCQLSRQRRFLPGELIDRCIPGTGLRSLPQLFTQLLHLFPDRPGLRTRILEYLPGLHLLIRSQVQLSQ
jgi:hypothetical protein